MRIVVLPLSITSSWGNGHATNYRALARALARRGHHVTFLERDVPWYAAARDLQTFDHGDIHLYASVDDLRARFEPHVRDADVVVIGSYVPEGVEVASWVLESAGGLVVFYDIDTPVTLEKLSKGDHEYLAPDLIPRFDLYLSFTGGPTLEVLETELGARRAVAFYCIFDPDEYRPVERDLRWDLGYLGTDSPDRRKPLEELLVEPARRSPTRRFCVAGPNHPDARWPANVERIDHLPPHRHRDFYCSQRFTLNVTRAQMIAAGHSPSVRLFEAAACGIAIISDRWPGLDEVLVPGEEILLVDSASDVIDLLTNLPEEDRRAVGEAARRRVLAEHSAERRVEELERYLQEATEVGHATAG